MSRAARGLDGPLAHESKIYCKMICMAQQTPSDDLTLRPFAPRRGGAVGTTLLFGGTFDPVHHGHLITAQAARELLGAADVLFVPASRSPHKAQARPASGADRLEMLRLAIAGVPRFGVSHVEVERGGASYTIDTLHALKATYPGKNFTLLMGADQLPKLYTWRNVRQIVRLAELAILARRGGTEAVFSQLREQWTDAEIRRFRDALLETPGVDISATDIRRRVREGLSIDFLTPPKVVDYIKLHGLYEAQ